LATLQKYLATLKGVATLQFDNHWLSSLLFQLYIFLHIFYKIFSYNAKVSVEGLSEDGELRMRCGFLQLLACFQHRLGLAEVPVLLTLGHLGPNEMLQRIAVGELDVVAVRITNESLKENTNLIVLCRTIIFGKL
jgi:hypothetical protein